MKLCDFGSARFSRDARYYRATGDVALVPWQPGAGGTLGYVAPELLRRQHFDSGVDVWSAGVVLFELLAGFAPFFPAAECLERAASLPASVAVSAEAADLCLRMLARDPRERLSASAARAHAWFLPSLS